MRITSRKNFKKMVEAIVSLYNEGNAHRVYFRAKWAGSPVEYGLYVEEGGLYIEETYEFNAIGGWFFTPEEVTISGVFHRIYPHKGRYYSNGYYRHRVQGNHPRLHRGRGDN